MIEATTPNGTLLFGYDINGIRISRSQNGITTNYVVDHNQQYAQVLAETENGIATKQYTYGDDLLSQTEGAGQERFFMYDGLGTTRALADGSEAATDTYVYEAFGELLASTGTSDNGYRYTGEQYDSGLDQYYLRARYYDQGVGRFTQMDTWMGRSQDPVTLNKYLYANADPVWHVDPSGHFSLSESSVTHTIVTELALMQADGGLAQLNILGISDPTIDAARSAAQLAGAAYLLRVAGKSLMKFVKACRKTKKCDWEVPRRANHNKQRKHIQGTNEHKVSSQGGTKSLIHDSVDTDSLIRRYSGTGSRRAGEYGKAGYKEAVDFHQEIGYYVPKGSQNKIPTTKGMIHYGKDGAHIVPMDPSS